VHGVTSLAGILSDIKTNRIEFPGVNRAFHLPPRWPKLKACSLLDSLYRGYPAGSLLLWQPHADYRDGLYHSDPTRRLFVVDGTHRLSTLYYSMVRFHNDDRISFHPMDEVFLPFSESIKEVPEYLPCAPALWCPENQVFDIFKAHLADLRASREVSEDEERHIAHTFANVQRMMAYSFPFACLGADYTEEDIAELRARLHAGPD
jgi:hypothetical protein